MFVNASLVHIYSKGTIEERTMKKDESSSIYGSALFNKSRDYIQFESEF